MSLIKLNYKKIGHGPPLLILHGLFGSLDNWQTIANSLQEKMTVYLLDLRNHGKSPHSDEMSYSSMAGDILYFINELQLSSCFLSGHSMGGKVVLQCLNFFPDRIVKAMVVDITARRYEPSHLEIFKALKSLNLLNIHKRSEAEEKLVFLIPEFSTRQFILKNLERNQDGTFKWKFNLDALEKNYSEICDLIPLNQLINVPTAFIKGENSNYIQEDDLQNIGKYFTKANFYTIKNAGHWVHADNPIETIQLMSDFFTQ